VGDHDLPAAGCEQKGLGLDGGKSISSAHNYLWTGGDGTANYAQTVGRTAGFAPGLDRPRPGILTELALSHEQGIHFQGDMTNVETLIQANIQAAKQAILTAGIDSVNLETAYKNQHINPNLDVWVRLHHSGLAELLDLSRQPQIHFFCPYQQAADAVVDHILVHNHAA
jgi:hypothetical protein